MLARLLIGLLKGLVVGGLIGFGLAQLGFAMPGAIIAYLMAPLVGVLVGLVAGKPIWAKDARIEAGMKAAVGAILAPLLLFAARRWLQVPLPEPLGEAFGATGAVAGTLGGMAVTSLAMVAAVVGGFFEADNTPGEPTAGDPKKPAAAAGTKRIASADAEADLEDELDVEPEQKRAKK
ncbi:MAG: hypothetical protein WKG00_39705 [Polyangiaceae bacterium]